MEKFKTINDPNYMKSEALRVSFNDLLLNKSLLFFFTCHTIKHEFGETVDLVTDNLILIPNINKLEISSETLLIITVFGRAFIIPRESQGRSEKFPLN